MPSYVTNEGAESLLDGTFAYLSATIKARLCTAGTIDQAQTSMTGQTGATGSIDLTLSGKTVAKVASNRVAFSATSPLTWTGLTHTGNATHICIYRFNTDDAGSTPIAFIDIADQSLTGATQASFTIDGTNGLFYLQQ
jgi:hypothetical protein